MRLIVIGGGAAGFFCAVNAARMNPRLEVIIVEKTNKLLSKVRVSGGGRCNVTHDCDSIAEMIRKYPRGTIFLKKAFHQFFINDTVSWFKERGVQLKTEEDGRMFPVTDSSQTIINCLLNEVNRYKVGILMNKDVKSLMPSGERWKIGFANGEQLDSDFICVASGGYPKAGMFEWITATGHSIEAPVPSLFTFNMPGNKITELMGVSVSEAQVRVKGTKLSERGPLLITHWGMSGPVILRLSAWGARELQKLNYEFMALINWIPEYNENSLREYLQHLRYDLAAQLVSIRNPFQLPQRLWQHLLQQSGLNENLRWADVPAALQNKLIKNVCAGEYLVKGKTTFKEEFVTAGGIKLSEVDANTMESKLCANLHFAGEILDVDGITGGFNFQHAWTSGWVAAKSIAEKAMLHVEG
jgi:hypothetical protein